MHYDGFRQGKNNALPGQTTDFALFFQKNPQTLDVKRPTFDDSPPVILSSSRRTDFNVFSERDAFPEFTRSNGDHSATNANFSTVKFPAFFPNRLSFPRLSPFLFVDSNFCSFRPLPFRPARRRTHRERSPKTPLRSRRGRFCRESCVRRAAL